tara:strand:+ start:418 stop:978 length:561 start_codon:yes stop_codon:yes gene_type:complete
MELSVATSITADENINSSIDLTKYSDNDVRLLENQWVLWAHLPHDINWSIDSYINLVSINTVEDTLRLNKTIPDKMIKNCMLFLMKDGINPTWEDKRNTNGGCFSFKIPNKVVPQVWKDLLCCTVGETISQDRKFLENVNGITISPKKSFCIIKIWMASLEFQNPRVIYNIDNLIVQGCLFKKHKN